MILDERRNHINYFYKNKILILKKINGTRITDIVEATNCSWKIIEHQQFLTIFFKIHENEMKSIYFGSKEKVLMKKLT